MSFKANVNAAYDNTTIIGTDTNRFRENATAFVYNNSFEFKDSMKQANEYTYDANGNLTRTNDCNLTNDCCRADNKKNIYGNEDYNL